MRRLVDDGQPNPSIDPLGDGISKVELLWVAGDDLEVVNDARVSHAAEHDVFTTEAKAGQQSDAGLVKFLQRNEHWTPFAGSMIKLRIKMPIYIAREWYRHEVGFNRNEVSRRYVKITPEFYLPTQLRQAPKPGENKQGMQDAPIVEFNGAYVVTMNDIMEEAVNQYDSLIASNVAPEQARVILPQSMYTEFRETASLAAYMRLCKQRISPNAMLECRRYAEAVYTLIQPFFPYSWEFQL